MDLKELQAQKLCTSQIHSSTKASPPSPLTPSHAVSRCGRATAEATTLPTLRVRDLEPAVLRVDVNESVVAGDRVLVQTTVQPTNDVTYLRGIRTTSHVPADLKPYLPLYASVRTDEHCDGPAGPPLTCFRRDPCRPGADVDGHQGTVQGGVHPRLGNGVRRRHRLADPHAVA